MSAVAVSVTRVMEQPESGDDGWMAATRAAYDTVAANYADLLADSLAQHPFDRAVLSLYAELVHAAAGVSDTKPQVVDVGCGPGRITAHLAGLGLDASGIDLSPAMIDQARQRHPGLKFAVGSMTALDELPPSTPSPWDGPDGLDGLVAWYSVIHVPPARHPAVYAGFRRVLRTGGHLLLAFQRGDVKREITEAYGKQGLRYDAYRLQPDQVEAELADAGFAHVARLARAPIGQEKTPQAYVIARAE